MFCSLEFINVLEHDEQIRRYNIDEVDLSQSPAPDRRPRLFRPKGLLKDLEDDSDTPDEDDHLDESFLKQVIMTAESNQLAQIVNSTQHLNQMNCNNILYEDQHIISQKMMSRFDHSFESTISLDHNPPRYAETNLNQVIEVVSSNSDFISGHHRRAYPPIERQGLIDDHDRPFAEYGHLGMMVNDIILL